MGLGGRARGPVGPYGCVYDSLLQRPTGWRNGLCGPFAPGDMALPRSSSPCATAARNRAAGEMTAAAKGSPMSSTAFGSAREPGARSAHPIPVRRKSEESPAGHAAARALDVERPDGDGDRTTACSASRRPATQTLRFVVDAACLPTELCSWTSWADNDAAVSGSSDARRKARHDAGEWGRA